VQAKFAKTVRFVAVLAAACATPTTPGTPTRDNPASPTRSTLPPSASAARTSAPPPERQPDPPPAAPAPSAPAASARLTGSAYFGCGEPIPPAHLWDETTEPQVFEAISAAKLCAAKEGRRLLLEFVAPWCGDCREMARLDETPVVAQTLRTRFERVRINIGKWDRHEALRTSYGVRALATYIVIDPKSSKELAKTTLEPVTKKGKKLSAEEWAAWLSRY